MRNSLVNPGLSNDICYINSCQQVFHYLYPFLFTFICVISVNRSCELIDASTLEISSTEVPPLPAGLGVGIGGGCCACEGCGGGGCMCCCCCCCTGG